MNQKSLVEKLNVRLGKRIQALFLHEAVQEFQAHVGEGGVLGPPQHVQRAEKGMFECQVHLMGNGQKIGVGDFLRFFVA